MDLRDTEGKPDLYARLILPSQTPRHTCPTIINTNLQPDASSSSPRPSLILRPTRTCRRNPTPSSPLCSIQSMPLHISLPLNYHQQQPQLHHGHLRPRTSPVNHNQTSPRRSNPSKRATKPSLHPSPSPLPNLTTRDNDEHKPLRYSRVWRC